MILLNADKISLSYTEKVLLNEVSLAANEGDKIGIIGVNGTGKSTFLKILAGKLEPEKGKMSYARNISISYLQQNPEFDENLTALEYVLTGFDNNKYPKEHEAMSVLNKMGVENYDLKMSQLSGGQKRRAAIAKALIFPCEVLILDEPTNHIDNETAIFLEEYLAKYKGAIIMVTHDRYFLDRVSNKIVEIDNGNLYTYNTNYEGFLQAKAEREDMELASERKRQSILRTELEWLKRGARARGTKSRYRIENIEKIKENALDVNNDKLDISSISSRLGKQIIEIENITKKYDNTTYINDFSYNLLRDDRIGIVGENGCGKSTLLKIIMGNISPDSGNIKIGQTVKIGYFSQECEDMDINKKVIDYIKDYGEYVETKEGKVSASKLLETFLFPSNLQYSQISRLSGGERRRLYLLSILITAPNVLLLDEPTNDLDITTLGILEDYIESFDGAVIAVSHDRYFLDRVAQKIFAFENGGNVKQYLGGYTDYSLQREDEKQPEKSAKKEKLNIKEDKTVKAKFSYNEQREYNEIDNIISDLENKIEETTQEINTTTTDYVKLQELTDKKEELKQQLEEKMERWVYLNDIAEKIANQK